MSNPFIHTDPSQLDLLNVSRRAAAARASSQDEGLDESLARYWLAEADRLDQVAESMAARLDLAARCAWLSLA